MPSPVCTHLISKSTTYVQDGSPTKETENFPSTGLFDMSIRQINKKAMTISNGKEPRGTEQTYETRPPGLGRSASITDPGTRRPNKRESSPPRGTNTPHSTWTKSRR